MKKFIVCFFIFSCSITFGKTKLPYFWEPRLWEAIAMAESSCGAHNFGDRDEKGKYQSFGMFQMKYHETAVKKLGFKGKKKDLLNPEISLEYAQKYLAKLLVENDFDLYRALDAYNRGEEKAYKWPYRRLVKGKDGKKYRRSWENHWYIKRILEALRSKEKCDLDYLFKDSNDS